MLKRQKPANFSCHFFYAKLFGNRCKLQLRFFQSRDKFEFAPSCTGDSRTMKSRGSSRCSRESDAGDRRGRRRSRPADAEVLVMTVVLTTRLRSVPAAGGRSGSGRSAPCVARRLLPPTTAAAANFLPGQPAPPTSNWYPSANTAITVEGTR